MIDGSCTWLVVDVRDGTPVGTVRGSLYLPAGYIIADGSTVQRADYPRLVALADEHNLWRDENVSYAITGTTIKATASVDTVCNMQSSTTGIEITDISTDDLKKIRIGDTLTATQLQSDTIVIAIDYSKNLIRINLPCKTAGTKITINGNGSGRHEGLFGRGDGTTTLVLPNYINRMIQLAADNAGLHLDAGLPNLFGTIYNTSGNYSRVSFQGNGLFWNSPIKAGLSVYPDSGWEGQFFGIDASLYSSIYGNSKTVQPPAITLLPILRY